MAGYNSGKKGIIMAIKHNRSRSRTQHHSSRTQRTDNRKPEPNAVLDYYESAEDELAEAARIFKRAIHQEGSAVPERWELHTIPATTPSP